MLVFIIFVFLSSKFLFIMSESEDNGRITMAIDRNDGVTCRTSFDSYVFKEGYNVTLIIPKETIINEGFWNLIDTKSLSQSNPSQILLSDTLKQDYTTLVNKSMEGIWEIEFYIHRDNVNFGQNMNVVKKQYGNHTYTSTVCKANVNIVSATKDSSTTRTIIEAVLGAAAITIIGAQTAYIVFLKAQARKLDAHNNLSKKAEHVIDTNDTARYCSNPGQKVMKVAAPVNDNDRESNIYEAPNIELSDRAPCIPPQPPALESLPRTPRPDHNKRVGPQAMLASALKSPARSPTDSHNHPPTFPRPNHIERETNVVNRPQLPLPLQDHRFEVYEEMETEYNTYEPPPPKNKPGRRPVPKKDPTLRLNVKEDTLKPRPANKPSVTPKPQHRPNMMSSNEFEQALRRRNDTVPKVNELEQPRRRRNNDVNPANELEEALRRRNNAMQTPMVSNHDPATRGASSEATNHRPAPLKSKPRAPVITVPVQEEIYYNENQESSDEEWTYEPLKPLKSYDPNIYNI